MSYVLRAVLIVGTFLALWVVVARVRKGRIRVADSVFWVVCAVLLLLLAIFPQIAFFFSGLLGFLSPSNFVLCAIIAIMLYKLFDLSCQLSRLTDKLEQTAQELALAKGEASGETEGRAPEGGRPNAMEEANRERGQQ